MSQYNKIKFSQHWDKLHDSKFTTIRSWNASKEEYYISKIGEKFTVLYVDHPYQQRPGTLICHAWLESVWQINPRKLPQKILDKDVMLNEKVMDDWLQKLLKMDKALLLKFSKSNPSVQKNLEEYGNGGE